MEVSSTSMNVASVTVSAITQGLIDPSGIRNFEMSLFFMALAISRSVSMTTFSDALFRDHRGVHVHSRPQNRYILRDRIENDLYGNALHNLHVVAGGVFRRQQAQHRARCAGDGIDMAAKCAAVGIDLYFRFLPGLHA